MEIGIHTLNRSAEMSIESEAVAGIRTGPGGVAEYELEMKVMGYIRK